MDTACHPEHSVYIRLTLGAKGVWVMTRGHQCHTMQGGPAALGPLASPPAPLPLTVTATDLAISVALQFPKCHTKCAQVIWRMCK